MNKEKAQKLMSIPRRFPGSLHPSQSDNFTADFNQDRARIYAHLEDLQRQVEVLTESLVGKGLLPNNKAKIYVDNPMPGRVYLEAGCYAVAGAVGFTETVLEQGYELGRRQFVILSINHAGNESLIVSENPDTAINEVLVGVVEADGSANNNSPFIQRAGIDSKCLLSSHMPTTTEGSVV